MSFFLKHIKYNKLFYVLFVIVLLVIAGCSNSLSTGEEKVYETKSPGAKEVMSLTEDELVGEIKERNETSIDFKDERSNKLPIGAKIFTTKEGDEIIVESEGKTLKYYALKVRLFIYIQSGRDCKRKEELTFINIS